MTNKSISPIEILAASRDVLKKNGFVEVENFDLSELDSSSNLLFEDAYSLIALIVYSTWGDLKRNWVEAQTSFVELISKHIAREERKSWDGYLLLWTTDFTPNSETSERQRIQYDTGRVRKLVTTGENLAQLADVERALLPLLPITESFQQDLRTDVMARVPELLATEGLSESQILVAIDAFENQKSAMESLHNLGEHQ